MSHQTVVSLFASTTTQTALIVKAALDTNRYDTAVKVTEEQLIQLRLTPHPFHGAWNLYVDSAQEKLTKLLLSAP